MKPYRTIPIEECGELLVSIPAKDFAFFEPHPYIALGASYGGVSPWMLRKGVLQALERAQSRLTAARPGWSLMLFDAYRPNAIQSFMVEREFSIQASAEGLDPARLTSDDRERLGKKVFRLWGIPSDNPATPPPHSTGGALDCTLADENGQEISMGSPVDELSDRSNPNYFASVPGEAAKHAHAHRVFLHDLMRAEGFHRLDNEWWHFSLGDQHWAWHECQNNSDSKTVAIYGRADLI